MKLKVKAVKQKTDYCAVACIKMILQYCEIPVGTQDEVFRQANKDDKPGLYIKEVTQYLHSKGISCIRITGKGLNTLKYYIKQYRMPLMGFTPDHVFLIVGYKNKWLYILDPNYKIIRRKNISILDCLENIYATKILRKK